MVLIGPIVMAIIVAACYAIHLIAILITLSIVIAIVLLIFVIKMYKKRKCKKRNDQINLYNKNKANVAWNISTETDERMIKYEIRKLKQFMTDIVNPALEIKKENISGKTVYVVNQQTFTEFYQADLYALRVKRKQAELASLEKRLIEIEGVSP